MVMMAGWLAGVLCCEKRFVKQQYQQQTFCVLRTGHHLSFGRATPSGFLQVRGGKYVEERKKQENALPKKGETKNQRKNENKQNM